MRTTFRSVERLPIRLVLLYVAATFFVFAFGPFEWPVDNWTSLIAFLCLSMACLWIGFRCAIASAPMGSIAIEPRWIIIIGSGGAVALLFIAAPVYTGKMPWEVYDALGDQGGAYSALQDQLELTVGSRGPIALARILTWPFVFGALALGFLRWKHLRAPFRLLVCVILVSISILSILRGTDRESADLFALALSLVGVLAARQIVHKGVSLRKVIHSARYAVIAGTILLIGVATLFIQRKEGRFGEADTLCVAQTEQDPGICADFEYAPFELLGLERRSRFNTSMAAAYFGQGYYGLSLALDLEGFRSTRGIGHAPFLAALYASITGDDELYTHSYTYRLRDLGWSDQHQWSTMFPWLANDISFTGVLILMLLIGTAFGASWRDAVFANDDRAAIVFAIFCIMLFYLPANSQVTLVPDHYFALVVWLSLWLCSRQQTLRRNFKKALG
jgi:hypothetical protein